MTNTSNTAPIEWEIEINGNVHSKPIDGWPQEVNYRVFKWFNNRWKARLDGRGTPVKKPDSDLSPPDWYIQLGKLHKTKEDAMQACRIDRVKRDVLIRELHS